MSDAAPVPSELLQHAAFVRRLARSLLRDPHAAADVEQETWRASLEHPPGRGGDPRGWLARVLRNFALRRRRSEGRREARERQVARAESQPPEQAGLERTEFLQRVVDAVRALEEPYRATILARFYEDLPPSVIAAREGVPVETVNTRLKRALARLRERLERGREDWRSALGLLAGESPCLPVDVAGGTLLAKTMTVAAFTASAAIVVTVWNAVGSTPSAPARSGEPAAVLAGRDGTGLSPAAAGSRERAGVTAPLPRERVLAGHVRDEQGVPVDGARVYVVGHHDPFGASDPNPRIHLNHFHGRTFVTDAGGHWRAVLPGGDAPDRPDCRDCHQDEPAELPEPGRVFVALGPRASYESLDPGRWVSVPAEDVDFRVRRVPTGTLEVRVFEGDSRRPLEDFKISTSIAEVLPDGATRFLFFQSQRSQDGVARVDVGLPEGASRLRVSLLEPDVRSLLARLGIVDVEGPRQEVRLFQGATEQVVFVLPERGVVRGVVVDAQGAPVPDALVFFGEETRARGDEPFERLRFERVLDGARTAADGWFELRGEGEIVTAVHAELSGATVEFARAGRIELGPRGAIRGRLLGPGGRPAAGLPLRLTEDGPTTTTDALGRFAFEHLERGTHAVFAGEQEYPLACVRLAAGEERELELVPSDPSELVLELRGVPEDGAAPRRALLIGREPVFDVRMAEAGSEPGTLVLARPRPGTYWLVCDDGWCAPVVLDARDARLAVELGTSELAVACSRRTSVQLVPADADPFLRLLAARLRVRVEPEAPALLRAAPGAYLLVGEAGAVLRALELPAGGLELGLD